MHSTCILLSSKILNLYSFSSRYSIDYGSVHYVVMSTEHNFTQGSIQYQFLESDFMNVNRSLTPWLVVVGHRYIVCTIL